MTLSCPCQCVPMAYVFCFHGYTWLYSSLANVCPWHMFFASMGGHASVLALALYYHGIHFLLPWVHMALFWPCLCVPMAYVFCFHGYTWLYSGLAYVCPWHMFFASMGTHDSILALPMCAHGICFLPPWVHMTLSCPCLCMPMAYVFCFHGYT